MNVLAEVDKIVQAVEERSAEKMHAVAEIFSHRHDDPATAVYLRALGRSYTKEEEK